jgi:Txe/YoeB family toxin of toxin-antitoxin system
MEDSIVFEVRLTPAALADWEIASKSGQASIIRKIEDAMTLLARAPRSSPPPLKSLVGDLEGCLARRLSLHHRIIYIVDDANLEVKVLSMWGAAEL